MKLVAVVRANGERTENASIRLAQQQLSDAVHVLHISPFVDAVRECFNIAIEADADWLMTIDADTMTLPGSIRKLVSMAVSMPSDVVQYQGSFCCKLFGGVRQGGHRMYRVRHLPSALEVLEPSQRVEADMLRKLVQRRLKIVERDRVSVVTGLHDYEQFYRDIYQKAHVHSEKHPYWKGKITNRWIGSRDPDLKCALAGFRGIKFDMPEKEPLPDDWLPF